MRFIGSKAKLLKNIDMVISENTDGNEKIFCDIFSGTGSVARYFKPRYEILSNDTLYFSYVIQKATIENNSRPEFSKLRSIGIRDPFSFLEETQVQILDYDDAHYFITKNYTPHAGCERMYLSNKNAARVDFIRNTIEAWKRDGMLRELEYYYLLAGLIEGVPSVSNITGTYGAYLKYWDKRAFKDLELSRLDVFNNHRNNTSYNRDANELIRDLSGDILYLDPPYNSRQYVPNYHLLETISKYDYPEIHGITGMRPCNNVKSPFCIKGEVADAFEDLVSKADFRNIVMSYSTDGLMTASEIEKILKRHGVEESYKMYSVPYRQYMSKKTMQKEYLYEYIFYIRKNIPKKLHFEFCETSRPDSAATADTKKYIKSPVNYIGGKYKLLPQILPNFPRYIGTFVDLFAGGCNVAINVNANKIICNDINTKIIEIFQAFKDTAISEILRQIKTRIAEYGLSKENEVGFKQFRNYYNATQNPIDLYTLACYSFNYQFRFNNNLEYNNPFGRNRSRFSDNMEHNLITFVFKLQRLNIEFSSIDFMQIPLDSLAYDDLIYCDPPYLITTGTYNDGNRGFKDWKLEQESALYDYLDAANVRGIKFALSNVIEHKGKVNELLSTWACKYRIIDLSMSYSNSSYNTKRGESREVLIINY
ncbi:Dam family site-specific DNA-(adenine-N6)-methyltransferase [Cloacibacillus sp. An23]|uniref:Dam family site-specific DNA-(adenine-N6)-methyltransferase n=1 Tax=Cloacibacillus sp. An23 TaxID=1965591 RepID=UPI000B3A5D90|nr:Dam family site-specific DNA-(adenine-N6)-methyltransferase [Cloacibacillus sp. An23]OUO94415.1 DNA adenine methylase [Cloacibacillus sp. An23]